MKSPKPTTGTTGYVSAASEHTCPRCLGVLVRIRRRAIDRLWSLFVPVHRYRCPHFSCQWEGNLRVRSRVAGTMNNAPR